MSYNSRIFTTNEQKLCTTYRELIKLVNSLMIYENFFIETDHFLNVLKDHKPILSCLTKKRNFSPRFHTVHRQFTKNQKLCIIYTKEKIFLWLLL